MSTTTAAELVSRADLLVRELRNGTFRVGRDDWEKFDVTVYRLLHQLVGPGRADDNRSAVLAHAAVVHVLQNYPTPLRPPVGATVYSVRQAAQFLGLPRDGVLYRIHRGDIPATTDGRSYGIAASDLDRRPDLVPADPTDPRLLPRLTCTFGVLADLLVAERERPASVLHDDADVAALMAHVLTLTAVTARHTLSHGRVTDADRPLAVAKFAERAVDALGPVGRLHGLDRIISSAPPPCPTTLNERLEVALRSWAITAREELNRTVPSTEVLRNIANQGRHIYAVTDRLLQASGRDLTPARAPGQGTGPSPNPGTGPYPAQSPPVSTALREASEALRRVDDQWASVTTATQPSHEYVAAARDLFTILKDVGLLPLVPIEPSHTEPALDLQQALSDLHIAGLDLGELLRDSQHVPEVLIRSEVLFAPVRALKPSLDRLSSRNRGGYVVVATAEVPNLAGSIQRAGAACRVTSDVLQTVVGADPLGHALSRQELKIHPPDSAPGFA